MIYTALKFPGDTSLYLGLTKESAKEAVWGILLKLLNDYSIAHTYSESKLEIELLNGSRIRITGADADRLSDRLRGRKHKLVVVDECAFYSSIDKLILSAILPTLSDLQGKLVMSSSPGLVPRGLFYEADEGKQSANWSRYHWTAADNPHFMRPSEKPEYATLWEEELDTICKLQFNGDREHPTFEREYLGKWRFDERTLCYPFDPKNVIPVEENVRDSSYTLGLNLSSVSNFGAVVVKCGDYNREAQVVESFAFKAQDLNELAATIEDVLERFGIERVLCYIGDHPRSIIDDFRGRYKLPLTVARHEKLEYYQKLIATDMASGFVKVVAGSSDALIKEWSGIVKDDKDEELPDQETLLADAFFVAYLDVYTTVLKQTAPVETDDVRMERQLREAAMQELADMTEEMGLYNDD
jgi:hypothetical protein